MDGNRVNADQEVKVRQYGDALKLKNRRKRWRYAAEETDEVKWRQAKTAHEVIIKSGTITGAEDSDRDQRSTKSLGASATRQPARGSAGAEAPR